MLDPGFFSTPPSILIVDDTPINLHLLSAMLKERGYRPRPVISGFAALAAAEAEEPDLILLDIAMPQMNGYQVCAEIKARPQLADIPVIFLSAFGEVEDKIKGLKAGGIDYLTKPFRIEEIEARIETHLKVRMLQKKLKLQNTRLEEMVASRTRELDEAYKRLSSLDKLKSEYLVMLSHEMRTPSNGILGIGELLFDLCPDSDEKQQYMELFQASRQRLLRLLDDTQHLTRFDQSVDERSDATVRVSELWAQMPSFLKKIPEAPAASMLEIKITGSAEDLQLLLTTCEEIATCFQTQGELPTAQFDLPSRRIKFIFPLDKLRLSKEEMPSFFDLSSEIRTRSAAESIGLAPVVARKTAEWLGGTLQFTPSDLPKARLELSLPLKNLTV